MMKPIRKLYTIVGIFIVLGICMPTASFGQTLAKGLDPYPGAGIFAAGDLGETFLPTWVGKTYYETQDDPNNTFHLVRVGNLERQWTTPTENYPVGDRMHIPWKQDIELIEYTPGINSFTTSSDPRAKDYVYAFETSHVSLPPPYDQRDLGDDGAHWVDPQKRSQLIYSSEGPTNLGIYVKMRVRQYTINHANMNDFIAIEFELTNTGVLDADGDGNPESTNNRINCMVMNMRSEPINSMTNNNQGRRGASGWFTGPTEGYDGTPDEDGYPWDVPVNFTGPAPSNLTESRTFSTASGKQATILWAPDGERELGNTMNRNRWYQDIYAGHQWIAAKQGPLPENGSSVNQEDKKTIYDSHPVGENEQRGWYTSVSKGYGNNDHNPWENHVLSMGSFYANGGRIWDRTAFDLTPDPNYFDTSQPFTPGDPLSFVGIEKPEAQRGRPNGSMQYSNQWTQNWERNNPDPADDWTEGYSFGHGFDGDFYVGIGPFSLEVGETMNLVLVEYAGFRLQGARQTRKSAQWAYENSWNVHEPPPMPHVKVEPSVNVKVNVKWDDVAETAPDFAGYKIYRSTAFPEFNSRELGRRILDHYHEQTVENPTDAELAEFGVPNNPNISAAGDFYRTQQGGAWGPYKLIKNIPASELSSYLNTDGDASQFKYTFEDTDELVQFGFTYWYYVAAYDNESGTIADQPFTSLETHKTNWNGRSGLWEGTYHFAEASSFFPTSLEGQAAIGANFVLAAPLADAQNLVSGDLKIRVKPNPYKKQALHDVDLEHKLLFFNLPTDTRITIFDVAGQVIDVLQFTGTNPNDGTLFWDMFSKDGIEVSSGLYIYVAEYPGGAQTGYFSIIR
ncbi:hypothetical protein GWN75_24245 [candidate division KSB1 bacterium]|nr:hypothetical protein [candidate division KSB1 bacterium]NIR72899.1 hypothetical protein [candidate division KSB1 bacterium]NIU27569.1 hypothetical protein [candidate division KSB1 bacterium]NIU94190.1 hypothetical protein [candidate division KSB1 bacterium]NIW21506.1 hypothetical protein [candidate division KSB1 bacterium]